MQIQGSRRVATVGDALRRLSRRVWHITYRCHRWDYSFKFAKDHSRWMALLFETKRHHRLSILDFTITSNHIHLVLTSVKNRNSKSKAWVPVARLKRIHKRRNHRIVKRSELDSIPVFLSAQNRGCHSEYNRPSPLT